ncbi:predicted protein [Pyrenophora tritici-repentis Pt-1C-BFP]|uniref:Uncharacterized protein n=1 Tax=Pyrenophora tritici-repentis (strain Pt-1C-BFP) TaxID=426418 RepID=B2W625_PYRTR|nr:uncharacterized protein PTRG_06183 [Pyrenophora tritici-repentis Pt-1C-BFP]EDU49103.1 predicted protein [Pyrenophora tritici-repentis Pt-1C-BFP]
MVSAPQGKREALHPPVNARARLALASCHGAFPVTGLGSLSCCFQTPALKLAPASCGVSDPCQIATATQHPKPPDLLPSSYLDPLIGGFVLSAAGTFTLEIHHGIIIIMLHPSLLSGTNIKTAIVIWAQRLSATPTVGHHRQILMSPLLLHVLQRVGTTIDLHPAYLEEGAQGENDAADQPDPKLNHLPRGAYTIYDGRVELMTQSLDIGATLINIQHGHIQHRHLTGNLSIRLLILAHHQHDRADYQIMGPLFPFSHPLHRLSYTTLHAHVGSSPGKS